MTVKRLAAELRAYSLNDLRIAVSDVENAEPAEAIEIFLPRDVAIAVRPGIGPFDGCSGMLDRRCFPVFEEARIDVIAETIDGLPRDPLRVLRRDGGRLDKF